MEVIQLDSRRRIKNTSMSNSNRKQLLGVTRIFLGMNLNSTLKPWLSLKATDFVSRTWNPSWINSQTFRSKFSLTWSTSITKLFVSQCCNLKRRSRLKSENVRTWKKSNRISKKRLMTLRQDSTKSMKETKTKKMAIKTKLHVTSKNLNKKLTT
jgi:hypothetical protein